MAPPLLTTKLYIPPTRNKLVQRNRTLFAATTSMVAILMIGMIATTWQMLRAIKAEQSAVAEAHRADLPGAQRVAERFHRRVDPRMDLVHLADLLRQRHPAE